MRVAVLNLSNVERQIVLDESGHNARYADGYLVYARGQDHVLMKVPFDLSRLEVTGNPEQLLNTVAGGNSGAAAFSVSAGGSLAFVPGGQNVAPVFERSLIWVDGEGRETPASAYTRAYEAVRFSPDGETVALQISDANTAAAGTEVWTLDLDRDTLTAQTSLDNKIRARQFGRLMAGD